MLRYQIKIKFRKCLYIFTSLILCNVYYAKTAESDNKIKIYESVYTRKCTYRYYRNLTSFPFLLSFISVKRHDNLMTIFYYKNVKISSCYAIMHFKILRRPLFICFIRTYFQLYVTELN